MKLVIVGVICLFIGFFAHNWMFTTQVMEDLELKCQTETAEYIELIELYKQRVGELEAEK